jgi:hypothetical protein
MFHHFKLRNSLARKIGYFLIYNLQNHEWKQFMAKKFTP